MANEKSKAEQYRDERKARIAKSAKKNAHSMEARNSAKKVAKKVVAIVLCCVIVLGVAGGILNYYGVPQRFITVAAVGSEQKVTMAEYQYYYMQSYNQLYEQAQYYQYYYSSDIGFDTSLAPDAQTQTTQDSDGNEITWVEYLEDQTLQTIQLYKAYYSEALERGITLTDAEKDNIDSQIEELRQTAKEAGQSDSDSIGYSLNAYLRRAYGNAVNERFIRKQMKIQILAQKYVYERTLEISNGYSQDEIDKEYKEDTASYDFVTYRVYKFIPDTLTAEDDESDEALEARQDKENAATKKEAESFLKAATNEKNFVAQANALNKDTEGYDVDAETKFTHLQSAVKSATTEDVSKWLFNSSTKDGSVKLFTNSDSDSGNDEYYVVLAVKGHHQEQTVTARHILFLTQDSSTGEALSDSEKAEKKQKAEDVLAEYNKGDKTEESFAALANEYSEDTGSVSVVDVIGTGSYSSTTGGKYYNIYPNQMVTNFDNWVFDADRKAGDVELIETDYGYHIMYFVQKDGKDYYDSTIRLTKASEDLQEEAEELLAGDKYAISTAPHLAPYSEEKVLDKINYLLEIQSANSSYSSY